MEDPTTVLDGPNSLQRYVKAVSTLFSKAEVQLLDVQILNPQELQVKVWTLSPIKQSES